MIAVKYRKTINGKYISHIDMLRQITRMIRRSGLDINYSSGFNPHMLIKMSSPCPLGLMSEAEYILIDCNDTDIDKVENMLKSVSRPLIEILKLWYVTTNPNFQGRVYSGDYIIKAPENVVDKLLSIMDKSEILINYVSKRKERTINARELIYGMEKYKKGVIVRLALGNITLRIDRLLKYFEENLGIYISLDEVARINQYINENGKEISYDEVLDGDK